MYDFIFKLSIANHYRILSIHLNITWDPSLYIDRSYGSSRPFLHPIVTGLLQRHPPWPSWRSAKSVAIVLNTSARMIFGARWHYHVTPLLRDKLRWLRTLECIVYKWCWLTFRALYDTFCQECLLTLVHRQHWPNNIYSSDPAIGLYCTSLPRWRRQS